MPPNCGRRIRGRKSYGWRNQCIFGTCGRRTVGRLVPCEIHGGESSRKAQIARKNGLGATI